MKRGKTAVYFIVLAFILVIGFTIGFANFKSGLTGKVTADPSSRYQQLKTCLEQGGTLTACRLASTISLEEYQRSNLPGVQENPLDGAKQRREAYKQMIKTIWRNKKDYLAQYIHRDLSAPQTTEYVLYNLQGYTNNILEYAGQEKDLEILDELASLYLLTYNYLELKEEYSYYYLPGQPRIAVLPLSPPAKMWLYYPPEAPEGLEDILANAQFLFVIGEALNVFLALPEQERTPVIHQFIEKFAPVLKDHYTRWVFAPQGMFQVTGWGCTVGMFNANDFLEKKMHREFVSRSNNPIGYCNHITDTDTWILTGTVQLLAANAKNPALVPLEQQEKERFLGYVDLGSRTLQSRLTPSSLTDFNNHPVQGLNFDLGGSDDHPDYAYTAYTGEAFPTEANKGYARNRGWDISHGTRFVPVFNTLHQNRMVTNQQFPDERVMQGLTNQLLYGVFNKNLERPLFTNFMDGTNGWYRVNYHAGVSQDGHPPSDLSLAIFRGHYGIWSRFNKDMEKVLGAFERIVQAKIAQQRQQQGDPEFILFIDRYYGLPRQTMDSQTNRFNTERSLELMNFLPTLVMVTGEDQEQEAVS